MAAGLFAAAAGIVPVASPPAAMPPGVTPGALAPRVAVAAGGEHAYALYLPAAYHPGRRWPVVFVVDSRDQGAELAALFAPGAERYGWVVVSPLGTLNTRPPSENLAAWRAAWVDAHERLVLDERRTYGGAFSGMVRFVTGLALAAPGTLAGIVGLNGGFPLGAGGEVGTFPFAATVGDGDFHYYEAFDLASKRGAAGVAHRLEVFAGSHEWPPPEPVTRALGWLELRAMREGRRPRDAALVATLWEEELRRARELDNAGDRVEAWRAWSGLVADFDGLRDVAPAAARLAELHADPASEQALRDHASRLQRDRRYLERAPELMRAARHQEGGGVAELLAALDVPALRHTAREHADKAERRAAERLLYAVYIQAALYLPRAFNEQGEHRRALFFLEVAASVDPEVPHVPYRQAITWALLGNRREGLRALERAVALGWRDAEAALAEPAFAGWREEAHFRELVGRMRDAGE